MAFYGWTGLHAESQPFNDKLRSDPTWAWLLGSRFKPADVQGPIGKIMHVQEQLLPERDNFHEVGFEPTRLPTRSLLGAYADGGGLY